MKKALIIVGTIVFAAAVACKGKSDVANEVRTARLTMINGKVTCSNNGIERSINLGDYLTAADVLKTEKGAGAEIFIKGQGLMKVSESTEIQMGKVLSGDQTSVDVKSGSVAVFLKKQDRQGEFTIKSPTAVAGVRGTSFLVTVDSQESSRFALLDGAIELKNAKSSVVMGKQGEITVGIDTDLSKATIQPLSQGAIDQLKKIAVFQRSNLGEYNSLVDELKTSEGVKGLEVSGNVQDRYVQLSEDTRRPDESVQKTRRAEENVIKRDTTSDPLKLPANQKF